MTFSNFYKPHDTEISVGIKRENGESFTVDGLLACACGCGCDVVLWRMFPTRAAWYDQGVFVKRKENNETS